MNTSTFAALLREQRLAAELSQEMLAEAARISVSAVSAYERGLRTVPHRETVRLLADALGLTGTARAEFEAVARPKTAAAAPSSRATASERTTLPIETTSFVGREHEVDEIVAALGIHRLVTLTGPGGIGKTRVALAVARRLQATRDDGVRFADLAALRDPATLAQRVASALNVAGLNDSARHFAESIRDRDFLIVLDNCEHLAAAAARLVAAIVQTCPDVTLLVTSRERLRVSGEMVFRIPSLSLDESGAAMRLFAERARLADRRITLSGDRSADVMAICTRLDGIPLAIELAAARVASLGIAELRDQLNERLMSLAGGNRDLPTRQQTMHATLRWSYDLLTDAERVLFRRLSMFAGGWTFDAARSACADDAFTRMDVADVLASLVERSLVHAELDAGRTRYRFLEVTRAYARELAVVESEIARNERAHARWAADASDVADESYTVAPHQAWHERFDHEIDNVRAALTWALGSGNDALLAARIVSGFRGIWIDTGLIAELRRWASAILPSIDPEKHPLEAARLLRALGPTTRGTERIAISERAIALFASAGDGPGEAASWAQLGYALKQSEDQARADDALNRACALYVEHGREDSRSMAAALMARAAIRHRMGRIGEARSDYDRALAISALLHDDYFYWHAQVEMAEFDFQTGDAGAAVARVTEALDGFRDFHSGRDEMFALCNRAVYRLIAGDLHGGRDDAIGAVMRARDQDPIVVTTAIQHLATAAALAGDGVRAARLLGYVEETNRVSGTRREPTEQIGYDRLMQALEALLTREAATGYQADGARLSDQRAIEAALAGGS